MVNNKKLTNHQVFINNKKLGTRIEILALNSALVIPRNSLSNEIVYLYFDKFSYWTTGSWG
jgi:hypothetical protein